MPSSTARGLLGGAPGASCSSSALERCFRMREFLEHPPFVLTDCDCLTNVVRHDVLFSVSDTSVCLEV